MCENEDNALAKLCSETDDQIYYPDGALFMQLMNPKNPRKYVKVDGKMKKLSSGVRRRFSGNALWTHTRYLSWLYIETLGKRSKNGLRKDPSSPPRSDSPRDIHTQFVHDLAAGCVWVNYEMNGKKMDCIMDASSALFRSWRLSGSEELLRYHLRDPKNGKLRRIRACRVFFITTDGYLKSGLMNVSFLCQNTWCLNPEHMVMELHRESAKRDRCPGNDSCNSKVKCLQPGCYFGCDADTI